MKKLFITFFFSLAVQWLHAQCINNFTVVPTNGTLPSNAKLTVNTPACIGIPNYMISLTGQGFLPQERTVVAGTSYTFEGLQEGTYSVTISDPTTGLTSVTKGQLLSSSYKPLSVREIITYGHTVRDMAQTPRNDGELQFYMDGGIGRVLNVKLETSRGYVIEKDFTRTNRFVPTFVQFAPHSIAGATITHNGNPVPVINKTYLNSGETVTVTITDLADGKTSLQSVSPPFSTVIERSELMPGSFEWEVSHLDKYIDPSICKIKYRYTLRQKGGVGNIAPFHRLRLGRNRIAFDRYIKDSTETYVTGSVTGKRVLVKINNSFFETGYNFQEGETLTFEFKEKYGAQRLLEKIEFVVPSTNEIVNEVTALSLQNISKTGGCNSELAVRTQLSGFIVPTSKLNFLSRRVPIFFRWIVDTSSSAAYIANKFNYIVHKKVGTTWVLQSLGTDYSVDPSDVAKIVFTPTPALPPNGSVTYMVTAKFLNASGVECYSAKKEITLKNEVINKVVEYSNFLKSAKKIYGIYEGTAGFVFKNLPSTISYPAKLKIQPTDGRTSQIIKSSLPINQTSIVPICLATPTPITKVFNYPLEVDLLPKKLDSSYGLDEIGIGDLPSGTYSLTLEDECGFAHTEVLNLDTPALFRKLPKIEILEDCMFNTIKFDLGDYHYSDDLMVSLQNNTGRGIGNPLKGRTGEFTNILRGQTYKIVVSSYKYTGDNLTTKYDVVWSLMAPFPFSLVSSIPAGLPYNDISHPGKDTGSEKLARVAGKIITEEIAAFTVPLRHFNPRVSSMNCDNTSGSGIILVDIAHIRPFSDNITYSLLQEVVSGTQTVTVEVQPSRTLPKATTNTVFVGVADGNYIVRVEAGCEMASLPIRVDSSAGYFITNSYIICYECMSWNRCYFFCKCIGYSF